MKRFTAELDGNESGGSSSAEEFETSSPKSVSRYHRVVHHQVLKIREEDSHLGKDIGEGLSTKDKLAFLHLRSNLDAFLRENSHELLFCNNNKPMLPASPLSGKTAIKSLY